jgi:hypothetical protein
VREKPIRNNESLEKYISNRNGEEWTNERYSLWKELIDNGI